MKATFGFGAYLALATTGACSVGFGAAAGVSINTRGDVSLTTRVHTRTGWGSDAEHGNKVVWFMPQLSVGVGYDLQASRLRLDAGVPSFGWGHYDGGWRVGAQLMAPRVGITRRGGQWGQAYACAGAKLDYSHAAHTATHFDSDFATRRQMVGVTAEPDVCVTRTRRVIAQLMLAPAYEYLFLP